MAESSIIRNRQKRILQILKDTGKVNVNELSEQLNVSLVTIRRDLDSLDEQGFLDRTHGGAVLSEDIISSFSFDQKMTICTTERVAIAKTVDTMINDGDTILMNTGMTTLKIMNEIRYKDVTVITNNASAINLMKDVHMHLMLLGGDYSEFSHSLVGDLTTLGLSQFYSNITILGVNGIDPEIGMTSTLSRETGVNRMMIERSRGKIIVVADHSKLGKVANFVTAPISKINTLVTDSNADPSILREFEMVGIEVIIANMHASDD